MIIQIGTEVDESRILWKYKESDEWKRADIDDLIYAYENRPKGEWIPVRKVYVTSKADFPNIHIEWETATEPDDVDAVRCSECGEVFDFEDARNWCTECGAKMKGVDDD